MTITTTTDADLARAERLARLSARRGGARPEQITAELPLDALSLDAVVSGRQAVVITSPISPWAAPTTAVAPARPVRRRSPAAAAKIATVGLSTTALLGMMAAFGIADRRAEQAGQAAAAAPLVPATPAAGLPPVPPLPAPTVPAVTTPVTAPIVVATAPATPAASATAAPTVATTPPAPAPVPVPVAIDLAVPAAPPPPPAPAPAPQQQAQPQAQSSGS